MKKIPIGHPNYDGVCMDEGDLIRPIASGPYGPKVFPAKIFWRESFLAGFFSARK